jgi:hypothetical protein
MRRRAFLTLAGNAAVAFATSSSLRAQEPGRNYRLGVLVPSDRDTPPVVTFFDELRRNGFIEGQNLTVIPGGFGMQDDQSVEFSAALVKAAPDAIICSGGGARILQRLTRTIPLVAMSEDMFAEGLVASLARPEGNITGISILSPELDWIIRRLSGAQWGRNEVAS